MKDLNDSKQSIEKDIRIFSEYIRQKEETSGGIDNPNLNTKEIEELCTKYGYIFTNNGKTDSQLSAATKIPSLIQVNKILTYLNKSENLIKTDLRKLEGYTDKSDKYNEGIRDKVRTIQKKGGDGYGFGEPDPYLAVLVADGDKMGSAISSISSPDDHRKFSQELSKFASAARTIVENNHGSLVYSGGDDVLAFLPVDTCLDAARDLHEAFGSLNLTGTSDTDQNRPTNLTATSDTNQIRPTNLTATSDTDQNRPTLSVGIAIGHKLVPLEDLLEYGRAAEHHAKEPHRNGLAIHLYTRSSGDPVRLREEWASSTGFGLDTRLKTWIQFHLNDLLPDKAAYDLREFAKAYKGWEKPLPEKLLEKDLKRLLSKKRADRGRSEIQKEDITLLMTQAHSYEDLCHLANELILARSIAFNAKQAISSDIRREQ